MAAAIPFTSVDEFIRAIAKIDMLHAILGARAGKNRPLTPDDDFFLRPFAIHEVAAGDDELWDGATTFGECESLRFRVGDSVQCFEQGSWLSGVVVRHPVVDGETDVYEVKLHETGRRIRIDTDDHECIREGASRGILRYELIFVGFKVRQDHDNALNAMGAFGRDVQLAASTGPPELMGRCVTQLSTLFEQLTEGLYEAAIQAASKIVDIAVPDDWQDVRQGLVAEQLAQVLPPPPPAMPQAPQPPGDTRIGTSLKRGRPSATGELGGYLCPACGKDYSSSSSLYQHKRMRHPELICRQPVEDGKRPRGRPSADADLGEKRFICTVDGCAKAYASSPGLYQHRRAHHPELINYRR